MLFCLNNFYIGRFFLFSELHSQYYFHLFNIFLYFISFAVLWPVIFFYFFVLFAVVLIFKSCLFNNISINFINFMFEKLVKIFGSGIFFAFNIFAFSFFLYPFKLVVFNQCLYSVKTIRFLFKIVNIIHYIILNEI